MTLSETIIERRSLPDQVARAILEFLKSEGYRPGDRLPSTKALCERFGVGYPTLREAIQQLETLGFLRVRHGSGIYVERLGDPLFVANPMNVKLSPKVLLDLIQARKAIEPMAASLAALWADPQEIAEMRATLARSAQHIDDDAILSRSNMNFHRLVAKASGNEVFGQIMAILTEFFAMEQEAIMAIYAAREKDHQEHLQILAAIEQRDAEKAERLMMQHLEGVEAVLRRHFAGRESLGEGEST